MADYTKKAAIKAKAQFVIDGLMNKSQDVRSFMLVDVIAAKTRLPQQQVVNMIRGLANEN